MYNAFVHQHLYCSNEQMISREQTLESSRSVATLLQKQLQQAEKSNSSDLLYKKYVVLHDGNVWCWVTVSVWVLAARTGRGTSDELPGRARGNRHSQPVRLPRSAVASSYVTALITQHYDTFSSHTYFPRPSNPRELIL